MPKDINERIDLAKAKMGTVIKDFQSSDAPQFKGKSKEKRRQMAIAAKLEAERGPQETNEDLRKWFGKGKKGDWVRVGTDGEIKGACAREPGEGKPKCMPRSKAHSMDKDDRATAARRKRRKDPVADRRGKGNTPIMVNTEEFIPEGNEPTNPALWSKAKSLAKKKFDVYPSAYANGWAAKYYKSKGGSWKSVKEETVNEKCWDGYKRVGMKKKGNKMVPNCVPEEAEYTSDKDLREQNMVHSVHVKGEDKSKKFQDHVKGWGGELHYVSDKGAAYKFKKPHQARGFTAGIKTGFRHLDAEHDGEVHESKDPREYGYEGEMVMSQLKGVMNHAKQLHDMLEPNTDLPEWVQSKITLAYDYMQTAADYMATEMKEEVEQIDEFMGKISPPGPESIAHRKSNTAMRLRVADERRKARLSKKKTAMEEAEQIDEISAKTIDKYREQSHRKEYPGPKGSKKYEKRAKGREMAFNKLTGRAKVSATNEEAELEEARGSSYTLYHKSYTDAVNHALAHHAKSDIHASDDDRMHHIGLNSKKPSEGKTTSVNVPATHKKTGKKHMVHIQVYNKGGSHPYELNTYSSTAGKTHKEEVEQVQEALGKDNEWGRPELRKKFAAMTPGQESMTRDSIPEMDVFSGESVMKEEPLHEISALGAKKRAEFQAKIRKTLSDPKRIAKAKKQVAKKKAAEAEKPKNLLHQLHKTQSLNDYKVHFHSGEKERPHPGHVKKFMDKYHSLKSSIDKESFTNRAHKSHDDFKKVVNEECNQCEMEDNGVNPRYDDVMNKDSGGRIDDFDIVQLEHDVMTDIEGLRWEDMVDQYEDSELEWIDDPILDGGEGSEEVSTGELSKLVYPATQEVAEALTPQGRLKKKFAAIRTKSRRNMARNLALKRVSSPDRLKKRAVRSARNMVYKRLLRGRDRSTLSAAEKSRVEGMVKRFAPMVSRLTIRLIPKERKIEQKRLVNRSKRNQAKKKR